MKTISTFLLLLTLAAPAFGLPPAAFVRIEKIEGKVIEVIRNKDQLWEAIRVEVSSTSDPEKTQQLYSTIRRKTQYPIQDFKRPRGNELILMFPHEHLPPATNAGDRIRILQYALRGSDASLSPSHTRAEGEVVLNP